MSILGSLLSGFDLSVYYFIKITNNTYDHNEIMAMHKNLLMQRIHFHEHMSMSQALYSSSAEKG